MIKIFNNSNLNALFEIYKKELLDSLRDRKSLLMALLFPLIGSVTMGMMFGTLAKVTANKAASDLRLPVVNAERAPKLMDFLRQNDVKILSAPKDPDLSVKEGEHDVILVIPKSFAKDFRQGRPARLKLVVDESRQSAKTNIERTQQILSAYSKMIGRLRFVLRGVDPMISQTLIVLDHDVSTEASRAAMLLSMLPFFIISALFMGGYYIAIDSCAGELERGSLEPLFINPVPRSILMLGKFLTTLTYSLTSLSIALAGFALLPLLVNTDALGMDIQLNVHVLLQLFPLYIPVAALASTLQMLIATSSKSSKEAQAQISLMMLLPLIPGMLQAFVPFKPAAWMFVIPMFGDQILTTRMLRGDLIAWQHLALSTGTTSLLALLGLWLASRFFRSERLFGK